MPSSASTPWSRAVTRHGPADDCLANVSPHNRAVVTIGAFLAATPAT